MSISNLSRPNLYDFYMNSLTTNIINADNLNIVSTDESTSTSTGALLVPGGVGIKGNLYVGGIINGTLPTPSFDELHLTSTIQSTSISTGSMTTLGGVGITKDLYVGGTIHGTILTATIDELVVSSTIDSTSTSTGALRVNGGVGFAKNLNIGGDLNINQNFHSDGYIAADGEVSSISQFTCLGTLNSFDATSGSFVTSGGVGIAKNLNVGGDVIFLSTTFSTSTSTGSIICSGGVGIGSDLYVDGTVTGNSTINGVVIFGRGTIDSSNVSSGSIVTSGGAGIAKNLYVGGNISSNDIIQGLTINSNGTYDSSNISSGSLVTLGGAGIAKNLYVGGTIYGSVIGSLSTNSLHLTDTIDSSDVSTGTLIVDGGSGIAKNLNVGGNISSNNIIQGLTINSNGTYDSSNISTGSIVSLGGVGIAKKLYVGDDVVTSSTFRLFSGTDEMFNIGVSGGLETIFNNPVGNLFKFTESVDIGSANNQLVLRYTTSNVYSRFAVNSSGDMTIDCTGDDLNLASTDTIHILNTSQSSDTLTGALLISGGVAIAKKLNVGENTIITYTLGPQLSLNYDATNKALFEVNGAGDMTIDCSGNNLNFVSSDVVTVYNTTQSISDITGGFQVRGGVGCVGNIYAGGLIKASITTQSTDTYTGSLICAGGAGIAKDIYCGGNMYFTGTVYKEYQGQVTTPASGGATLTLGSGSFVQFWSFSGTVDQSVYCNFDVPHDYKLGSAVSLHIHYVNSTATAGDVIWSFAYTVCEPNGVLDESGTIGTKTVANSATLDLLNVVEIVSIPMTGITQYGTIIACKVGRNGSSDSYAGTSKLYNVAIHYQVDRMGTTSV